MRGYANIFDVILILVQRDFKGRYKHTIVGMLWSVLNPLLFLIVFYFIFDVVLDLAIPNYAAFVFIGILVWQWFQSGLLQSACCISGNQALVSQPSFPIAALPVVSTVMNMVNFVIALPLLLILLIVEGISISYHAFLIFPLIIIQALLVTSLSYAVAALNVKWRDVEHALPILLLLGYFITPIFYDASRLPPDLRVALYWNPVAWLVDAYRSILLHGRAPDWVPLVGITVGSLILLRLTTNYFMRARSTFLEEL